MTRPVLPELRQLHSPNWSSRAGTPIELAVQHETAGSYAGAVAWLRNPAAHASSHLVLREDGLEATQLVPLHLEAWTEAQFNPRGVSVELATVSPRGYAGERQLEVAARVFAWLLWKLELPPRWARGGHGKGLVRHLDLGAAGGGHLQCGLGLADWQRFLRMVDAELERGSFRRDWARL